MPDQQQVLVSSCSRADIVTVTGPWTLSRTILGESHEPVTWTWGVHIPLCAPRPHLVSIQHGNYQLTRSSASDTLHSPEFCLVSIRQHNLVVCEDGCVRYARWCYSPQRSSYFPVIFIAAIGFISKVITSSSNILLEYQLSLPCFVWEMKFEEKDNFSKLSVFFSLT